MPSPDVIIAGAGIVGVSIALELRQRGVQVLILDRQEPGLEASTAAAGLLAPADPETPPLLRPLAFASARLFPGYVQQLESSSGMAVDFRRQGTIAFVEGSSAPSQYRALSSDELSQIEPGISAGSRHAFFVQEDTVDPALLMQAALAAAAQSGIEIRTNVAVQELRTRDQDVEVVSEAGRFTSAAVVNCRGAWSGSPVKPRKGQALYLQPQQADMIQHAVVAPEVYLVPRSSGKIYVGATVEDVGYNKTVQAQVIEMLRRSAAALVPGLASSKIVASWAGLRPGSPDNLPLLGLTATSGVFAASGHFRNGILLAPITARIMADLLTGRSPGMDISAFSPLRFASIQPK